MRFTKEFKLECVRKYKAGEHDDEPGGYKRRTFMDSVRGWAKIYDALGEIGLEHKKPNLAEFEKLAWLMQDTGEVRCLRLLKCFTSIKN